MGTPYFAYLDNNVVSDFSEPRPPVDRTMRTEFLKAVEEGRLVIPFSQAIAQEIAAVTLSDRTRADQLARFYLKIASLDHALGPLRHALGRVIAECLGDPPASPYTRLTPRERGRAKERLLGRARRRRDVIVAEYRKDTETWVAAHRDLRERARGMMREEAEARAETLPKPARLRETVAVIWPGVAPGWAWRRVGSCGLVERTRQAGMSDEEILLIPGLRAAVGVEVALAVSQTLNGRDPRAGDFGDYRHVVQAACAGLPLVTQDEALRKVVDAIPDSPLETLSAEELLARAR